MRNSKKILLGLMAVVPAVLLVIDAGAAIVFRPPETEPNRLSDQAPLCFALALTAAAGLAVIGGFMFHLFRSGRAPVEKRWPWVVAMFLGAPISLPIYWYVHVWRAPDAPAPQLALTRSWKIALGVASAAIPLVSIMTFLATAATICAFVVPLFQTMFGQPRTTMSPDDRAVATEILLDSLFKKAEATVGKAQTANCFNFALRAVLTAVFVILAFGSDRLDRKTRLVWVLFLILFGRIAMPIYWYLYVWKDTEAPPPTAV